MIGIILSILVLIIIAMVGLLDVGSKIGGNETNIDEKLDKLLDKMTIYMKNKKTKDQYIKYFKEGIKLVDQKPIVTLDDIDHEFCYSPETHTYRPNAHIGQRKLFLTEIQFFTKKIKESKKMVCVYAGAAPSNHTGYLANLFPNIKFILIDPNPFEIREANPITLHFRGDPNIDHTRAEYLINQALKGNDQLYIINDLFTVELAESFNKLIKREDMVFVSDIRTNSHDDSFPDVLDILWNLAQQYVWIKKMSPSWSLLKFRHPFYSEDPQLFKESISKPPYEYDFKESKVLGLDFEQNWKDKKLIYFDGEVYIQAWPGRSSTETRLVTEGLNLKDWGLQNVYENKLFYYNQISRPWIHHYNPNADAKLGFDHCNDCSLENNIWEEYIEKYPETSKHFGTVKENVIKLSQITKRHLFRYGHGYRFKNFNINFVMKAVDNNLNQIKDI